MTIVKRNLHFSSMLKKSLKVIYQVYYYSIINLLFYTLTIVTLKLLRWTETTFYLKSIFRMYDLLWSCNILLFIQEETHWNNYCIIRSHYDRVRYVKLSWKTKYLLYYEAMHRLRWILWKYDIYTKFANFQFDWNLLEHTVWKIMEREGLILQKKNVKMYSIG